MSSLDVKVLLHIGFVANMSPMMDGLDDVYFDSISEYQTYLLPFWKKKTFYYKCNIITHINVNTNFKILKNNFIIL